MVVRLRWRVVSPRFCNPTTILRSCLGFLLENTFRLAWLSTKVTSMSAMEEWFSATTSLTETVDMGAVWEDEEEDIGFWLWLWGNVMNKSVEDADLCFICFCPSRDWRSCSSSLTKFMAPPTMEAWSPYSTITQKKLNNGTKYQLYIYWFNQRTYPLHVRRRH